jgi:hypothetical protein
MILKAKIYIDSWKPSRVCPAPPLDYPLQHKVDAFLDIFLKPQFFGRIVVWKNQSLRNPSDYRMTSKGTDYIMIDSLEEAVALRHSLRISCDYKGDLSILFVPKQASEFFCQIMKQGHYSEGKLTTIGTDSGEYQLIRSEGQDISFFLSGVFHSGERIFAFSHDAEYLFEIYRE